MSELVQTAENNTNVRRALLTGVSALALMIHAAAPSSAKAGDYHPNVWIELGGQLSRLGDETEIYSPDFTSTRPSIFLPSQNFETSPSFSFDEYGKISFQPNNSDWVLSASVRYGRATKNSHIRQQTYPSAKHYKLFPSSSSANFKVYPRAARFADTAVRNYEQHTIVDFQAGKDIGLGLFGKNSSSVVSVGVRFAQFSDRSNISLKSDPDWRFQYNTYYTSVNLIVQPYHSNAARFSAERSFRGVGPSFSWNGSAPFMGNPQGAELDFDWGLNAGLLFGRQKARTQHEETARYNDGGNGFVLLNQGTLVTVYHHAPPPQSRARSVIAPNVGAFAGISFKYAAAKVSFGYKADFFFGVMDGGIDVRRTEDVGFHGPYASISIGLGG